MSAQTATVVDFPQAKRAPEARPVNKLRVLEHVRRLVLEEQQERQHWKDQNKGNDKSCPTFLTLAALSVVQYLAEITDKETGAAIVELETIAARIGRSKETVKRQIRRLVNVGVIEREARRKGKRCYANAYRLIDFGSQATPPRVTNDPTPGHQRPPYARVLKPFPHCSFPNGLVPGRAPPADAEPRGDPNHAQQDDRDHAVCDIDRKAWAERLAPLLAKYYRDHGAHLGGDGIRECKKDLDTWCNWFGERALLGTLKRAMVARYGEPLYEQPLLDFIRKTKPEPGSPGAPALRQQHLSSGSGKSRSEGILAAMDRFAARGDPT